jgi:hypothetical protein
VSIKTGILQFYKTTRRHIKQDSSFQIIMNFYFSQTVYFFTFRSKTEILLSSVARVFFFFEREREREQSRGIWDLCMNRKKPFTSKSLGRHFCKVIFFKIKSTRMEKANKKNFGFPLLL